MYISVALCLARKKLLIYSCCCNVGLVRITIIKRRKDAFLLHMAHWLFVSASHSLQPNDGVSLKKASVVIHWDSFHLIPHLFADFFST